MKYATDVVYRQRVLDENRRAYAKADKGVINAASRARYANDAKWRAHIRAYAKCYYAAVRRVKQLKKYRADPSIRARTVYGNALRRHFNVKGANEWRDAASVLVEVKKLLRQRARGVVPSHERA